MSATSVSVQSKDALMLLHDQLFIAQQHRAQPAQHQLLRNIRPFELLQHAGPPFPQHGLGKDMRMDGRACNAGKEWVQGPPRLLNHARFPAFRKYRRSARWPRAALVLLTPAGRFALRATAHQADVRPAWFRCPHFRSLWAFGPARLGAPSGVWGPRSAQGTRFPTARLPGFGAVRSLNRRGGRWPAHRSFRSPHLQVAFGPLAQQPTRLTLPSGAPKPVPQPKKRPSASIKKNRPPPHKRERAATRPAGSIRQTDSPWDRAATRAGCRRCPQRPGT